MSADLIQLGLSKTTKAADVRELLVVVVERLINLVNEIPVESEQLKTSKFQAEMESFHARIIAAPNADQAIETLHHCLDACQAYFACARGRLNERETEFNEVFKVMRGALSELAGGSSDFHGNLLLTTKRLDQMTKIEDLRHLRSAITKEVGELKRFVAEKQKRDQASFMRLSKRIDGLRSKLKEAKEEATLDPLTRIPNRGSFDAALTDWIAVYQKRDTPFVLAMLDIDDFKQINDTHGHQIGDRVLVCASQWLSSNVRGEDLISRYGGEEFAVLLGDVKLKHAESKFSALLERVAASKYEYERGRESSCVVQFTFSCGLAEYHTSDTGETLLRRADDNLYQAKRNGKNQVRAKSRGMLGAIFGK